MRKFLLIAFFSLALSLGLLSCGLHGLFTDDLSDSRIVDALQEALFLGSQTAANNLSSPCANPSSGGCTSGYLGNTQKIDALGTTLEIALPDSVKHVIGGIDSFMGNIPSPIKSALPSLSGFQGYGSSIKETLNKGAEQAAKEAVPLFRDAIFEMSFSDARNILFGDDNTAATSYLKEKTFPQLKESFGGKLTAMLNKLKLNSFWSPIASNYNTFATGYKSLGANPAYSGINFPALPYKDGLPTDLSGYLSDYATGRALEGLFYMVGVQEAKLRADPWGAVKAVGSLITDTVGDLLVDVFGKAKEG
jgi:hypothetical protein